MNATVTDSINVKGRVANEYGATGVIAIFPTAGSGPKAGEMLLIVRPDGWMVRARVGKAKPHPQAYGVFLANLSKQQIPVGSTVRWGEQFWPDPMDREDSAATAGFSR